MSTEPLINLNNPSTSEGNATINMFSYSCGETKYVAVSSQGSVAFAGTTNDSNLRDFFSGISINRIFSLLVTAINNRTRERNFARLSEQLALEEISEKEYDEEIEMHEDLYVIKCDQKPSILELRTAMQIAPNILDVKDVDDFSVLFSFDEESLQQLYLR